MALIQCDFFAETLGVCVQMNVILPQTARRQIGMDSKECSDLPPVLYLLHGLSDDHTIWCRRTSIERYAADYGIAVVMPGVQRSYYRNMNPHLRYWDFVSSELPEVVSKFFRVSSKREDTFAAGNSMGGYGAFKLALNHPERFAAAASLSGSFENHWLENASPEEFRHIFTSREAIAGTEDDLMFQMKRLASSGAERPKLYMGVGTEDFLYDVNVQYRDLLQKLNYDLVYRERPGTHCWAFWDTEIRSVLQWLPIRKEKKA